MTFNLVDLGTALVSITPADQLVAAIAEAVRLDQHLTVDFHGVQVMTTSFCARSFGHAYRLHDTETLDDLIEIANADDHDTSLVRLIRELALTKWSRIHS